MQPVAVQSLVFALCDDQRVVVEVFGNDVPGLFAMFLAAADTQALSLPERVVHETAVHAQFFAVSCPDGPGIRRQVVAEELAKRSLPYEANAGTVFLVVNLKAGITGDFPYVAFMQFAQGKDRLGKRLRADGMQEVALVLVLVDPFP